MNRRVMAAAVSLALAACGGGGGGGGGSPTSLVGTLVDAPVAGVEFESASGKGITDSGGNFIYRDGETVSFRIGALALGAAKPQDRRVSPLELVGTANTSDARVIRMLRTLQSLDSDGDPENGIQISEAVRQTLARHDRLDLTSAATTDLQVTALIGEYKVSENEAREHFERHRGDHSGEDDDYTPPPANPGGTTGSYALVAWNDLGMHCTDGKDFSIFSILPPYNNLHAHLIDRSASSSKRVTSGVTLSYEAVLDTTGSINTESASKTNFWSWVGSLFGASPAPDRGLNLADPLVSNPTPSRSPAPMRYNSGTDWWEAEGIPITPYDDAGRKNFYPMVKVVARDSAGAELASTRVVLPVSDEMSCQSCHASGSADDARPSAGWIDDPDPEKDWKKNILRLHDEKFPDAIATAAMQSSYTGGGLLATANGGQPVLCAACHQSNALATPAKPGIKPLTEALHSQHATVKDPASGLALNDLSNRDSCYMCHPGSQTKCLRGAMGDARNPDGSNAMDCQSCHGNMAMVGAVGRQGWLDQPNCQSCHDKDAVTGSFVRHLSVFDASGAPRPVRDQRFATNANVPVAGVSLYRFSKGHGDLQCEACHGSTHAIYPSSHANDNVQSIELQGHTGTIAECTVCHSSVPNTRDGGPHGLHTIGQAWVGRHGDAAESRVSDCKSCHGSDYRGSALSRTSMARSFKADDKTRSYAAGDKVGCYDCHNGPRGED